MYGHNYPQFVFYRIDVANYGLKSHVQALHAENTTIGLLPLTLIDVYAKI